MSGLEIIQRIRSERHLYSAKMNLLKFDGLLQLCLLFSLACLSAQLVEGRGLATTTKPRTDLTKDGKPEMPPMKDVREPNSNIQELRSKMEGTFLDFIQNYEMNRKGCQLGQFFDIGKRTCERCDNYCPQGKDLSLCGLECREYYHHEEITDDVENSKTIRIFIVVALFCIFAIVATLVTILWTKNQKLKRQLEQISDKVESLTERNRAPPESDDVNGRNDCMIPLMETEKGEMEHIDVIPYSTEQENSC